MPVVASYNLRSLIPKIESLKNDIIERSVGLAFLQEIWEQSENKSHQFEIEKLLEINGLQYLSNPRPKNARGSSYGGVALIVNQKKFSCEKLNIPIPNGLEVIWGLVRPKNSQVKNMKMADHIASTLHMLSARYPDSVIILGADKNDMDISPILNCGLKLRQIVDQNTCKNKILNVIIMIYI